MKYFLVLVTFVGSLALAESHRDQPSTQKSRPVSEPASEGQGLGGECIVHSRASWNLVGSYEKRKKDVSASDGASECRELAQWLADIKMRQTGVTTLGEGTTYTGHVAYWELRHKDKNSQGKIISEGKVFSNSKSKYYVDSDGDFRVRVAGQRGQHYDPFQNDPHAIPSGSSK